jgi:phenylalanyl-tRNA synthetase beta chain
MIFSYNWISRYLEPGADAEEVATRLTAAGLAVESIEPHGKDMLFDVDVTTNRPDCMNHVGLAREAATLLGQRLRLPNSDTKDESPGVGEFARVFVEDDYGCPRYVARVVRGATVGPSPQWLVDRLEAIGQRSINNVVDITNFVLWELGQPIHAFDLAKLKEATIVVRRAKVGERLTTLDEVERKLDSETLVIADSERPVALAGIMGGFDSEVSASTEDILIESAHFDPARVRAGAKALGLHTDANHRFERGADPGICRVAADRVARMIVEIAGGRVAAGALDVESPHCDWQLGGQLNLDRAVRFAGVDLEASEVERWLTGVGFSMNQTAPGRWDIGVPTWRYYDMRPDPGKPIGEAQGPVFEADFFEEILRLHGLEGIPATLPAVGGPDLGSSIEHERRQAIRTHLAASGYLEAIAFAFHDEGADQRYPALESQGEPLRLANPLSELYAVMRRSLIPGLVGAAEFNQRRGCQAIRLFEIGHVFPGADHAESEVVSLIGGGQVDLPWDQASAFDLFELKGVVESLAKRFDVDVFADSADLPGLVAGTSSRLHRSTTAGPVIGLMGQLETDDSTYPLYVAELSTAIFNIEQVRPVELPSRFPGVEVDLTLTQSLATPWSEIVRVIDQAAVDDLVRFGLKDRYSGEGVPPGAVNTTIYFLYNAADSSLTRDAVNERHEAVRGLLEQRFGWKGDA